MRLIWRNAANTDWDFTDLEVEGYNRHAFSIKRSGMFYDWVAEARAPHSDDTWFHGGGTIREALIDLGKEMRASPDTPESIKVWSDAVDAIISHLRTTGIAHDAIG